MFSSGSGNTVIKSKLISRRMFLLSVSKAVVVVGVLGRLISLQINESKKYKTLSDSNRISLKFHAPSRGKIIDSQGNIIADNKNVYSLTYSYYNRNNIDSVLKSLKNFAKSTIS